MQMSSSLHWFQGQPVATLLCWVCRYLYWQYCKQTVRTSRFATAAKRSLLPYWIAAVTNQKQRLMPWRARTSPYTYRYPSPSSHPSMAYFIVQQRIYIEPLLLYKFLLSATGWIQGAEDITVECTHWSRYSLLFKLQPLKAEGKGPVLLLARHS